MRKILTGAAIVLAAALAFALWGWFQGAEKRAVARLPAAERGVLYQRELDSFRTLCGRGPREDALQKQCKERAEFIREFPECDAGCQQLAYTHTNVGRR